MTTAIERAREAIKKAESAASGGVRQLLGVAAVQTEISLLNAALHCRDAAILVAIAGTEPAVCRRAAVLCVEAWQAIRPREEVRAEAEAAVKAAFVAAPQYIAERLYRHWENDNVRKLFDDLLDVGGDGTAPTAAGLLAIEAVARWKRAEMEADDGSR